MFWAETDIVEPRHSLPRGWQRGRAAWPVGSIQAGNRWPAAFGAGPQGLSRRGSRLPSRRKSALTYREPWRPPARQGPNPMTRTDRDG
eukprot:scaffold537402_cov45-Prasinocladus_malaysianus.AAC.1